MDLVFSCWGEEYLGKIWEGNMHAVVSQFRLYIDLGLDIIEPYIPEFVTPNFLTKSRMYFFTPLVLVALCFSEFLAVSLYAIAALTDLLDGYLARKRNLFTEWGALWDERADKICVYVPLFAWFAWVAYNGVHVDIALLVLATALFARDVLLIYMRKYTNWVEDVQTPLSAKWKAAFQMVGVGFILASPELDFCYWIGVLCFLVALPLSSYSAYIYVGKKFEEWMFRQNVPSQ